MTGPSIVGLFEGYGGLTLGVSAVVGGVVTAYAEIDDAMCRVLAHHHPGVPNLGDVSGVEWDAHGSSVDVMCGGFPCQDVSLAGLGRGLAHGTRSGLWYQFARAIAETRPPLVVIENVRGLLSAPAAWRADNDDIAAALGSDEEEFTFVDDGVQLRAMGAVLGDLANLGYGAEWIGLRAADVGAPHGRFRVFIVAYPIDGAEARDPARRPFAAWSPARGVWESGGGDIDLFADAADVYAQSWPTSGAMIDGIAYERPADAPSLSEYVGALLPTPLVTDGTGGSKDITASEFSPQMRDIDKMLPTPTAAYATGGNAVRGGDRGDEQLLPSIARDVAAGVLLPTPDAYSGQRGGGMDPEGRRAGGHSVSLGDVIEHGARDGAIGNLLPTPVAHDSGELPEVHLGKKPGRRVVTSLAIMTENDLMSRGGDPTAEADLSSRWGKYAPRIALWEQVHGHPAPEPTIAAPRGGRRLSPWLTEWMMGLEPGHLNDPAIGLTSNQSLRGAGNGVVPRQAAVAVATLLCRFLRAPVAADPAVLVDSLERSAA